MKTMLVEHLVERNVYRAVSFEMKGTAAQVSAICESECPMSAAEAVFDHEGGDIEAVCTYKNFGRDRKLVRPYYYSVPTMAVKLMREVI